MSIENNINFTCIIHNKDPILIQSYINKQIKVIMKNCDNHYGLLYAFDPVSESVVLLERDNELFHAKIILGHFVKDIEVISHDRESISPQFYSTLRRPMAEAELNRKKMEIIKLFMDNRFPIIDNNDILEIEGVLFIEPPYQLENCICTNPIILSRIQNILSQVATK